MTRLGAVSGWRAAPVLVAGGVAALYLATSPPTGDLAAHVFRAGLFGREGLTVWDGQWYAGHHTPGYSVLFPPLAWALGPMVAGALAAVVAAALFEPLARRHFGEGARLGSLWFGAGTGSMLFANRLPFALGVALGLGALLAWQRRRPIASPALGATCSLASPVAGLLLALAAAAGALAAAGRGSGDLGRERWVRPLPGTLLAAAALAPPLALAAAFPEPGYQPFVFSSFAAVPAFCAVALVVLPRSERALTIGVALYGVAGTLAFLFETAMGGNAVRLGALFGGPVLACVVVGHRGWRSRPLVALVLLAPLAVWQWSAAVRDSARAFADPATRPAYWRPLLDYLATTGSGPVRVEIPLTATHWEAAEVAPRFAIGRGWLRQVDTGHNPLFYEGILDDRAYERWLTENGIRFVALPRAALDYSAVREAALVRRDPPYLALRWRSPGWRVYEVTAPHALVTPGPGVDVELKELRSNEFVLDGRGPGQVLVRVRWTPYWHARGGCVERAGDWTRVTIRRPGLVRVGIRFSLARVFARGRRCG